MNNARSSLIDITKRRSNRRKKSHTSDQNQQIEQQSRSIITNQSLKISDIKVGKRFRKDLGKIDELVDSIKNNCLLCPIVVTKGEYLLIDGARRIEAYRQLCIPDIPGFRMLRDSGSLLTYASHYALPQIFDYMKNSGLTYWWIFAMIHGGGIIIMTSQDSEYSVMTKACLVEHLKQHLASIESEEEGKYDNRKYYIQAHNQLKIGAFKPVPFFTIYLSDLSPNLIRELHGLNCQDRGFVLKQAVGRIFEDVNFGIYHNSVSRVLRVKLQ